MPNAQQNNNIVIMVEISIIINHNYCYCPLLRCRVWQSTTGSSSANIGCSRKSVSLFKLENVFWNYVLKVLYDSHVLISLFKFENFVLRILFHSCVLTRQPRAAATVGRTRVRRPGCSCTRQRIRIVSEKKVQEHQDHEPY